MADPYLQLNGTLCNLLGHTDPAKLAQVEAQFTALRLVTLERFGLRGTVDFKRLKETHRFVFQGVYDWAGKERVTNLYKAAEVGGPLNRFEKVQVIATEAEWMSSRLAKADALKNLDPPTFAKRAADLFAAINQPHPFREGNGRAQRAFLSALAKEAGHEPAKERFVGSSILFAHIVPVVGGDHAEPVFVGQDFQHLVQPRLVLDAVVLQFNKEVVAVDV